MKYPAPITSKTTPDHHSAHIELNSGDYQLEDFRALEDAFGTKDIGFHVRSEEVGMAGEVWTEARLDIYIENITN